MRARGKRITPNTSNEYGVRDGTEEHEQGPMRRGFRATARGRRPAGGFSRPASDCWISRISPLDPKPIELAREVFPLEPDLTHLCPQGSATAPIDEILDFPSAAFRDQLYSAFGKVSDPTFDSHSPSLFQRGDAEKHSLDPAMDRQMDSYPVIGNTRIHEIPSDSLLAHGQEICNLPGPSSLCGGVPEALSETRFSPRFALVCRT